MPRNPAPGPLAKLLEQEAQALLEGDFATLSTLAPKREAALAALDSEEEAEAIRQLAKRNLRLAEAAAAGVRAARARLVLILRGASFDTYARDGQRQQFSDSRPSLQRRA
jgi:hypothetical protein